MFYCVSDLACIAKCLGSYGIPVNLGQCWSWCDKWLPQGKKVHVWGVAAICWAIWKARNNACLNKRLIKNPLEIICHACALMKYWTGQTELTLCWRWQWTSWRADGDNWMQGRRSRRRAAQVTTCLLVAALWCLNCICARSAVGTRCAVVICCGSSLLLIWCLGPGLATSYLMLVSWFRWLAPFLRRWLSACLFSLVLYL